MYCTWTNWFPRIPLPPSAPLRPPRLPQMARTHILPASLYRRHGHICTKSILAVSTMDLVPQTLSQAEPVYAPLRVAGPLVIASHGLLHKPSKISPYPSLSCPALQPTCFQYPCSIHHSARKAPLVWLYRLLLIGNPQCCAAMIASRFTVVASSNSKPYGLANLAP